MHGKVDGNLKFSGATVFTTGPIHWNGDPGDVPVDRMRLLDVTVTQGGTTATIAPNTDFEASADRSDGQWKATVKAKTGTWSTGSVHVVARVRLWPVAQTAAQFEEPAWDETVNLGPA